MLRRESDAVLAVRDIRDVEAYVRWILDEAALPLTQDHVEHLVRCGVRSVLSFERALPRERPLAPVLKPALRQRLVDRWQVLQVQESEATLHTPDTAAAA
jgi:hypothetical protein